MSRKNHLFLLLLLFVACKLDNIGSDSGVAPTPFFDLEAYFDQEIARLDSLQPKLEKTASIDGEVEKKRIEETDFEQELRVFRRSGINRPSWADKYQIDSIQEEGVLKKIQYTVLDTSLYTRLLSISFQDELVDSIRIQNRANSAIARTEQNLLYLPGRSYRIESVQKTIGAEERKVIVEVEIKK